MTEKIKCPQCHNGWQVIEEDGQRKDHPCYHCANTGFISPATARMDRIDEMTSSIARGLLEKKKKFFNENPDGEGWAFSAAESGMTPAEYEDANFVILWERVNSAIKIVEYNHPDIVDEMVAQILPIPDPVVEPKPTIKLIDFDWCPRFKPDDDDAQIPF